MKHRPAQRRKADFVPDPEDAKKLDWVIKLTGQSKSRLLRAALKMLLADLGDRKYSRPPWLDHARQIVMKEEGK